jgi:hypothetical protein
MLQFTSNNKKDAVESEAFINDRSTHQKFGEMTFKEIKDLPE